MTDKAMEILKHCNCVYYSSGINAGRMKVAPYAYAESKRIYGELVKGMWKDELNEIKAHLIAEHEAQLSAANIRLAKIDAIEEGIKEIRAAIDAVRRYDDEFNAMMEDEYNDGACPPKMPAVNVSELKAKYPRAAAYIKAENFSFASHDVKSAAGAKALEKIINGEDYTAAIAEMEREWEAYCMEHIFD